MLEDRALPSTITVLTTADGAGVFTPGASPTDTTLRGAIANAASGDTIVFASGLNGQPITLTGGRLTIGTNLTISGPGANNLTISGNNASGVFQISGGVTGSISGLTLTGGNSSNGGAVQVNSGGVLTLSQSTISGNTATNDGGAIYSSGGTVTVSYCTISGNSATNVGGGICDFGGAVTISNSTIAGNTSGSSGGGIYNNNATAALSASTISGNAGNRGGGIYTIFSTDTITNCTITGNSSSTIGGGICNFAGSDTISSSTITGNAANNGIGGGGGGGIYNGGSGTVTIQNTILAGNSAGGFGPDGAGSSGFTSNGYNLIGNDSFLTITPTTGDQVGTNGSPINPVLSPLANFGGPTLTIAPLIGSPALHAGVEDASVPTDQRGVSRPQGSSNPNIGAFEGLGSVVTNTNDSGAGSLRQAIADANVFGPGLASIAFLPSVFSTITLTSGALTINGGTNVQIVGPGSANLSVSGNNASQVFMVSSGATMTISGLTITSGTSGGTGGDISTAGTLTLINDSIQNGSASGNGGGISVAAGTLTLNNDIIQNDTANGNGGGISVAAGSLTINSCTFSNNAAAAHGGAIDSPGLNLTITNSTFNNNSAADGGGLSIGTGTVSITNSTFFGNTASGAGGAINSNFGAAFTLLGSTISGNAAAMGGGLYTISYNPTNIRNTIIAGNTASSSGPDVSGNITSNGHNLIGNSSGSNGLVNGSNGDQVGTSASPINAQLGPLANHGGPTQTMDLLFGSPAIDAGDPTGAPATDQRGLPRISGSTIDIGAVELQQYVVTNTNDGGSGSLRQAVLDNNAAGDGIITFDASLAGQTIILASGELAINQDVTILGPWSTLTISGNHASRIFDDAANVNVSLFGLTLIDGSSATGGGAILNAGTLNLSQSTISGNSAAEGGGIYNSSGGSLLISNSTVSGNTAQLSGGGIWTYGTLTLNNSTLSGNTAGSATSTGYGGGLYAAVGTSNTISDSTFSNNYARIAGGGILTAGGTSVAISNSTLAGNSTQYYGGGIANSWSGGALGSTMTITNSTLSANNAGSAGGGIFNGSPGVGLSLANTIVAGNTAPSSPDIQSTNTIASLGYNLIGIGPGSVLTPNSGDQIGTSASPINPQLGPLANNGGPTQTMALLFNSPAINAGQSIFAPGTDQRGQPRFGNTDIGAFEYQFKVLNTNDSGSGSLRQAILNADAVGGGHIIFMIGAVGSQQTIQPNSGGQGDLPVVTAPVFLDGWSQGGPGYVGPPLIQIDGSSDPNSFGFNIQAANVVVRGFDFANFAQTTGNGFGIGVFTANSTSDWIYGNYIGTDFSGTVAAANGQGGIWIGNGAGNILIGTNGDGVNDAAERNIIAGNAGGGILVQSGGNTIAGNYIGVAADGTTPLGNAGPGILIQGADNTIGGTAAADANLVNDNTGPGVQVDGGSASGNAILGNSTFNNGSPGILLTNGGNDTDPPPVLQYAFSTASATTVSGSLASVPNTLFRVEFFASPTQDSSGAGQGETFLGYATVMTNGSGMATFSLSSLPGVPVGQFLSATATDAGNNTSEFAQDVLITGTTSQLVLTGLPSVTTAGVSLTFSVQAEDSTGNVTPQYTGTVHFTSSDAQAVFAQDNVTLTNGVGTFGVTLNTAGTQSITATDTATSSLTVSLSVTVNPALSLTPGTAPAGGVALLYNTVFTQSGGTTPYTTFQVNNFSAGGTGLAAPTVSSNTISFNSTPTAAGTATFSIAVTDSAGASLTKSYSITIYPALSLPATNPPGGAVATPYTYAFQAGGGDGGPYTYSMTPTSFDGLTLSTGGVLSGTPTASGSFSFTVKVTDTNQPTFPAVSKSYTLVVLPTASLSELGSPFSENGGTVTITATLNGKSSQAVTIPLIFGGTAPSSDYTASAASITIPAGSISGSVTLTGVNNPSFGRAPLTVTVHLGSLTNGVAGNPSTVSLTITPDANAAFLASSYQLLLGRAPDSAGFAHWQGLLASGTTPSAVVQGMEGSQEFLGDLVQGVYHHYLGRAADSAGLTSWVSQLAAGVSLEQVTADILVSLEYQADHRLAPAPGQSPYLGFVQGLYQQVLGRPGSAAEWASWTTALDSGQLTPVQAALGFLTSREYNADLVNGGPLQYAPLWEGFYPELLHRAADPTGLAGWVAALQNHVTDQAVLAGILGSPEGYRYWS
jgi:hypothetical protein